MLRSMKILVAVNDSLCAGGAVEAADALCARVGGKLVLLHVVRDSRGGSGEGLPAGMGPELLRQGRELLSRMSDRVTKSAPPTQLLRRGTPSEQVLKTARQINADLIVIGTHGRGGLAHLLLGNETEPVVRLSPCPVMTVRHIEPKTAKKRRAPALS